MLTKKHLFTALLGGLAVAGCQKTATVATPQTNQPVAIAVNGSARVAENVTVQVDKIEDSRCPANVVCIRYGNANVSFALSKETARQSGTLCLGECGTKGLHDKDSTTVQLGSEQYKVVLTEVRPYPGTPTTETKQTAVLTVTKQ